MVANLSLNISHLDLIITDLKAQKDVWAKLPVKQKITYLEGIKKQVNHVAERWVKISSQAKGLTPDSPYVGEEWMAGPWALLHAVNGTLATLEAVQKNEMHRPLKVRARENGQVAVHTYPLDMLDSMLLNGYTAEVWMQESVTPQNLEDTIATFYKQKNPEGKLALVLGAGNIDSIPVLDVILKLFTEGQVCVLKMNPVNEFLTPIFEEIFAALIADDFLRIVRGGGDVGEYLARHHDVQEIHLTGSASTHDALVFGVGEEGKARKARGELLLNKRITSELGSICPVIVVPGQWSNADLHFQAENIITQRMHNGGHNCIATQVVILPDHWDQKDQFMDMLNKVGQSARLRPSYYPGTHNRYQHFMQHYTDEQISLKKQDQSPAPLTIVSDLDPDNVHEILFREETFCPILAQTSLPGKNNVEFLKNAVKFCNDTLWGTLGANIIIDPKTQKNLGKILEDTISSLQYGTVTVNVWAGGAFLLSQCAWGAYPGHTYEDVQSGIGTAHNSFMFDKPQKNVIHAPFYPFPRCLLHGEFHLSPRPAWFVTNEQQAVIGRRFTRYEGNRGFQHLPGLFLAALRGQFHI